MIIDSHFNLGAAALYDALKAGHVAGALNISVSGTSFATRAGFLLAPAGGLA